MWRKLFIIIVLLGSFLVGTSPSMLGAVRRYRSKRFENSGSAVWSTYWWKKCSCFSSFMRLSTATGRSRVLRTASRSAPAIAVGSPSSWKAFSLSRLRDQPIEGVAEAGLVTAHARWWFWSGRSHGQISRGRRKPRQMRQRRSL